MISTVKKVWPKQCQCQMFKENVVSASFHAYCFCIPLYDMPKFHPSVQNIFGFSRKLIFVSAISDFVKHREFFVKQKLIL